MRRLMALGSINTTPDKTEVQVTSNSISVKNKGCKGVVAKRIQCNFCSRLGVYQAGILAWNNCCNRDDGTWRKVQGHTKRPCKFYLEKQETEDGK